MFHACFCVKNSSEYQSHKSYQTIMIQKLANVSSLKTFRLRKLIGHESKNWVEFKLFLSDKMLITTFLDLYERRTTFFL